MFSALQAVSKSMTTSILSLILRSELILQKYAAFWPTLTIIPRFFRDLPKITSSTTAATPHAMKAGPSANLQQANVFLKTVSAIRKKSAWAKAESATSQHTSAPKAIRARKSSAWRNIQNVPDIMEFASQKKECA